MAAKIEDDVPLPGTSREVADSTPADDADDTPLSQATVDELNSMVAKAQAGEFKQLPEEPPQQELSRANRDDESRDNSRRTGASWRPQNRLPEPRPQHGWRFKWVRIGVLGNVDNRNVSTRFREGWQPVGLSEAQDLVGAVVLTDVDTRFEDALVIGGLMLCKMPEEEAQRRDRYYQDKARSQVRAIDNSLLSESDPRMPLNIRERNSKVEFGRGG